MSGDRHLDAFLEAWDSMSRDLRMELVADPRAAEMYAAASRLSARAALTSRPSLYPVRLDLDRTRSVGIGT